MLLYQAGPGAHVLNFQVLYKQRSSEGLLHRTWQEAYAHPSHFGEDLRTLGATSLTFLGATGVFGSCFCLSLSGAPGGGALCSGGRITGLPTSTGFISGPRIYK